MPFELPNVTEWTEIMGWTNSVTNNMWGIAILLSLFIVAFGVLRRSSNNEGALLGSMMITNISAVLFMSLGMIDGMVLVVTILGLIIAFVYYQFWG